jgi:predicted transcriptional regulator
MTSHVMSLRISDEMKEQLDRISSETNRSVSAIAEEALSDYVKQQEMEAAALDEAVARADRGDFVSHEAVADWLQTWGTAGEKPAPQPDILRKR